MDRIYLLPGESVYVPGPAQLSTLLGSCVAVCLHDTVRRWGGMNHYLLPEAPAAATELPGRYGRLSIEALIGSALSAGSLKKDLVASIYGGGNVLGLAGKEPGATTGNVGDKNIVLARSLLAEHGIAIVQLDVAGNRGRRIHFDTRANQVAVEHMQSGVGEDAASRPATPVRVALIDASPSERRMVRTGLAGVEGLALVGEAADAHAARDLILNESPDILCMDVHLPGINGAVFLERVFRFRHLPTVVLARRETRDAAFWDRIHAAGVFDMIEKDVLQLHLGVRGVRTLLVPRLLEAGEAARWRGWDR